MSDEMRNPQKESQAKLEAKVERMTAILKQFRQELSEHTQILDKFIRDVGAEFRSSDSRVADGEDALLRIGRVVEVLLEDRAEQIEAAEGKEAARAFVSRALLTNGPGQDVH